jgi:Na+/serine symporter
MEKFGVPKNIVGFVMPTGYTFNLDGSTLYLALGVLFATQIVGIHLSFQEQLVIMLALMLTSRVREVVQESGCTYLPRSFNYSKEVVRVPDFLVGMLLKDLPQGTVVTCLQEDLDEVLTCKVSHPDHPRNMDFAVWAHKSFRNQL